jgi:signal transduction histidine kinase
MDVAEADEKRYSTLLADDVGNLRTMFRIALEMSGRFEVVAEASNGHEAIELASRFQPQLVLLDISMPLLDGLQTLPGILKVSPGSSVVVLSGFEADRLAPLALESGAKAYLEKGLPPERLVERLLSVLGDQRPAPAPVVAAPPSPPGEIAEVSADELLAFVAHEIRNPLAILQGYGLTLEAHWAKMDDDQRLDIINRMIDGARYLDSIVTTVLHMRSLESGQLPIQAETVDSRRLLVAMIEDLRAAVEGHDFDATIADELPAVRVDSARLRQALTNLVVNAAKYGPAKGPVRLAATSEEGHLVIRVSDEGPGIPKPDREFAFGKFTRLQSGGKGLGLGLYISRFLIETMHGSIEIEDSRIGATFAVRLPAAG